MLVYPESAAQWFYFFPSSVKAIYGHFKYLMAYVEFMAPLRISPTPNLTLFSIKTKAFNKNNISPQKLPHDAIKEI